MRRAELTRLLAAATTAKERHDLLAANKRIADERLALAIKEYCYAGWAADPKVAQRSAAALKSLYKFNPSQTTRPYYCWISGIADLTRGRLETAIANMAEAGDAFLALGREHDSAKARVASMMALALLGRYDEAVTHGENILKILDKYGDDVAAGRVALNLGNIVSRRDLHTQAEKYYLSAKERFIRAGDKSSQIMAENGLAITYAQMNDFRRAGDVLADALEIARAGKMLLTEAELEASMGNLALFRGRYSEALALLELSRRKYEQLDMPHQTAVAGMEIADIYRELNLTEEAMDIYADVAETFKGLKLQGEEARARANLGRAGMTLGSVALARRNLKRSARLYELEKNRTGAGAAMLVEAELELGQGRAKEAMEVLRASEKMLGTSDSVRHRLKLKMLKASALKANGQRARAAKIYEDLTAEAHAQEQSATLLAGLNSLGKIALEKGEKAIATEYFRSAADLVEKMREPLGAEEFRMAFLADKLEPYENLAAISISDGLFTNALMYTEKARSRALADVLSQGANAGKREIPRKEADKLAKLREELNWFYNRLDRAREDEIAAIEAEIRGREKDIVDLGRRIESTRKGEAAGASWIDPQALQKRLGKKRALLEFIEKDGEFSAFVVDSENVRFVKALAKSDDVLEILDGLQFQFGTLRYGANLPEKFKAGLKDRADSYLRKLYDLLIRPLESLTGAKDLIVAPVGALYYVPFHALNDGRAYLVESREVLYAPSAAVWQALDSRARRKAKNTLLIGFADEKIPLVEKEIRALRQIVPGPASLTGKQATFGKYTKEAPRFDLIHFACHGHFRPENPMFSSLHLADGWVTVRDICAQKLKAGLVTLSACETGLNKLFAGDEILGLARGFLSAGVSSLVLSLWTVNDEAASRLMKRFYEELQRGSTPSASLRIAQIEFIKADEHPYYWSPFAVIGK